MRNGPDRPLAPGYAGRLQTARRVQVASTLLGMLSVLLLSGVHAEPSTIVRYLMNEPVNAFDFGLVRLADELDIDQVVCEGLTQMSLVNASATYDWDRNRIDVHLFVMTQEKAMTPAIAKSTCRKTLSTVRFNAGVDGATGKPIEGMANVADLFRPRSFARKDEPADVRTEVLTIVELRAFVFQAYQAGKSMAPVAVCEGMLLSKDVLFLE